MILSHQEISILLCPHMQFVSLSSNHALTWILQHSRLSLHEHACLFYKCNVDRVDKMPSNITVYDAEIKIKYSHLNHSVILLIRTL